MITDPFFYAVAIPAVFLVGLSKGGLGGAMAVIAVPLIALAIPPVQAAALRLPILIVMDMVSLWAWRHHSDRRTLVIMLPGAVIGIAIGWMTAALVTETLIKLIVGVVALGFSLQYFWKKYREHRAQEKIVPHAHRPLWGAFCGAISGFTSFVSHAGGPPYQLYTLPLGQDPKTYTGASVRYFAIVNAIKVVPYFLLGEFDATNLKTAAVLAPIAPLATLTGALIVRRMKPAVFYPVMYIMVLLTSFKLIYDGLAG